MASLQERLDRNPEGWRPEPGAKLVGTVVEVSEREGRFGSYPVVVVETDTGDLVSVRFPRVAQA